LAEAQRQLDQQRILAAKANDAALVRKLIQAGGNVNAKDAIQDSAFLYEGLKASTMSCGWPWPTARTLPAPTASVEPR
jgi:hypothetical protein